MRCTTEFSIELSDQDLADLPDTVEILKIADPGSVVAPAPAVSPTAANYDMVEIELTPEEMDDMLSSC